jgi:hypothetical protein
LYSPGFRHISEIYLSFLPGIMACVSDSWRSHPEIWKVVSLTAFSRSDHLLGLIVSGYAAPRKASVPFSKSYLLLSRRPHGKILRSSID